MSRMHTVLAATALLAAGIAPAHAQSDVVLDPDNIIIVGAHACPSFDEVALPANTGTHTTFLDVLSNDFVHLARNTDVKVTIVDQPKSGSATVLHDQKVMLRINNAAQFMGDTFTYKLSWEGRTSYTTTVNVYGPESVQLSEDQKIAVTQAEQNLCDQTRVW